MLYILCALSTTTVFQVVVHQHGPDIRSRDRALILINHPPPSKRGKRHSVIKLNQLENAP